MPKKSKVPCKSARKKMIHFNLCVVRHGETFENKNNIYQGQIDTVLSDEGIKQAELVAERFQNEKFTHAYSSDLRRAYKTGEYILNKNKHSEGVVLVKDPRIREKSYGILEGKSHECVKVLARKHNLTPKTYIPEGGETIDQLSKRAVNFFDDLCKNLAQNGDDEQESYEVTEAQSLETRVQETSSSKPVAHALVACHGGTIRQLFYHFARDIPSEFLCKGKEEIGKLCPNTGVSKFEVFVGKNTGKAEFIRCTMIYDGSHLTSEEERFLYEDHAL